MNIFRKFLALASISSYLYASSNYNNSAEIRNKMYENGKNISQKCKPYTFWDNFVEPLVIKQFGFFFGMGHSFIKGMISDNEYKLDGQLDKTITDIINEKSEK